MFDLDGRVRVAHATWFAARQVVRRLQFAFPGEMD
jgi:hypothetical protein